MAAKQLERRERLGVLAILPSSRTLVAFQRRRGVVATVARFSAPAAGPPSVDLASAVLLKVEWDVANGAQRPPSWNKALVDMIRHGVQYRTNLHLVLLNGAVLHALLSNTLKPELARSALCSPEQCDLFVHHWAHFNTCGFSSTICSAITSALHLLSLEV